MKIYNFEHNKNVELFCNLLTMVVKTLMTKKKNVSSVFILFSLLLISSLKIIKTKMLSKEITKSRLCKIDKSNHPGNYVL